MLLPVPDRFLNPSFSPIFFHGFSVRVLGLCARFRCGSLDGGVVGGVMGSPTLTLDWRLPESSVRVADPESPLALETWPEVQWEGLAMAVTELREKLGRLG